MSEATFGGETFDAKIDGPRLKGQLELVRQFMLDGRWHDLEEIARSTGTSMLSVSARVRDLRKPQFGGYMLEVKRVGQSGLWHNSQISAIAHLHAARLLGCGLPVSPLAQQQVAAGLAVRPVAVGVAGWRARQ